MSESDIRETSARLSEGVFVLRAFRGRYTKLSKDLIDLNTKPYLSEGVRLFLSALRGSDIIKLREVVPVLPPLPRQHRLPAPGHKSDGLQLWCCATGGRATIAGGPGKTAGNCLELNDAAAPAVARGWQAAQQQAPALARSGRQARKGQVRHPL